MDVPDINSSSPSFQELNDKKFVLRQRMKKLLSTLSAPRKQIAAQQACEQLISSFSRSQRGEENQNFPLPQAQNPLILDNDQRSFLICSFWPLPTEINLQQANQHLLSEKRLALPKIDPTTQTLDFYPVVEEEIDQLVSNPRYPKILEPANPNQAQKVEDWSQVALLLVPGLAFNSVGQRLGRGGGFYDRLIAKIRSEQPPNIKIIGLAYREQRLGRDLPYQTGQDQSVDEVWFF